MSNLTTSPISHTSSTKILPSEQSIKITWLDRYTKASVYAKIFLFGSAIHALSLIIGGAISVSWKQVPNIYGALSIFVAICFLWFVLQGVLKENAVQLICSILSAMLVTMYLVWFFFIDIHHPQPFVAVLVFGSTGFCVLYLVIAPCVIKKFGWYRYNKSQTTDRNIAEIYYVYQKFQAMILMDAEVCIMLGLLVTFELQHTYIAGYVGNIACIVFEIFWVVFGIASVRTEHRLLTQTFMACTIFVIVYVIVICYWTAADRQYSERTSQTQFFVLSTLVLIVRGLTMFWVWKVMANFDKGLRKYFDQGGHYVDFWGQSNQQLLAPNSSDFDNGVKKGGGDTKSEDGMSSRSRIRSDDFD